MFAGKDRTGALAATILLILVVPKETIIKNYLLSNIQRIERAKREMKDFPNEIKNPELIAFVSELMQVKRKCLGAFFNHFNSEEPLNENGKDKLDLTDEDKERFKKLYLI